VAVVGATAALAARIGDAGRARPIVALISVGRGVLRVLEFVRVGLEPITRGCSAPTGRFRREQRRLPHFEQEADAVMSRDQTHRAQKIIRAAVVVLVLLVVWACFAHVEE